MFALGWKVNFKSYLPASRAARCTLLLRRVLVQVHAEPRVELDVAGERPPAAAEEPTRRVEQRRGRHFELRIVLRVKDIRGSESNCEHDSRNM